MSSKVDNQMSAHPLTNLVNCSKCPSFADANYPPILPQAISEKGTIMFVGENPSWQAGQRHAFDTVTPSGKALLDHYLQPLICGLHLSQEDFWITDLFKCRYPKSIYHSKGKHRGLIYQVAATCATTWLAEEIKLVKPRLIVTLGNIEVYQRFRRIYSIESETPALFNEFTAYQRYKVTIAGRQTWLVPACHPDISYEHLRKRDTSKKWSSIHKSRFVQAVKEALEDAHNSSTTLR